MYDVRTTEELVRFFVVSYHDCFQGKVFNLVQNSERMTHCLGRLTESYELAEMMEKSGQLDPKIKKNIDRNKNEMFAYQIIALAMSIESLKLVMSIKWTNYTTIDEVNYIKEAIRIYQVIR